MIITAAVKVMREKSIYASAQDVANACEIVTSISSVRHYFPTVEDLRNAAASEDQEIRTACENAGLIKKG
jgi:AcrR family transcriptional regulator